MLAGCGAGHHRLQRGRPCADPAANSRLNIVPPWTGHTAYQRSGPTARVEPVLFWFFVIAVFYVPLFWKF
jgi:hypothetical protein